ncbi:hypothetical protein BCR44DRAFT_37843 [Catenaria anguillulae PL171]|uniref:Uncharacterized protein n=1 Tax=Catenaria anguillulae PL171 TaxID=765915 RepID=A0A1Y2HXE2_9FUNG|nr:hypothetical protein BCR44DRAFT_37843 [Catenaria anguillulae PL171]
MSSFNNNNNNITPLTGAALRNLGSPCYTNEECVDNLGLTDVRQSRDGCAYHEFYKGAIVKRCRNGTRTNGLFCHEFGGRLCSAHTRETLRILGCQGFKSREFLILRNLELRLEQLGLRSKWRRAQAHQSDDSRKYRYDLVICLDPTPHGFTQALEDRISRTPSWDKAHARDRCVVVEIDEDMDRSGNPLYDPIRQARRTDAALGGNGNIFHGRPDRHLLRVNAGLGRERLRPLDKPQALFAEGWNQETDHFEWFVPPDMDEAWEQYLDSLVNYVLRLLFTRSDLLLDRVHFFQYDEF